MKARLIAIALMALTLATLLAVASRAQVNPSLVIIPYHGSESLHVLEDIGLLVLRCQDDLLVALASEKQLSALYDAGFAPQIVAQPASADACYVVHAPPTPSQVGVELSNATSLGENAYLLVVDAAQAEKLSQAGAELERLQGPVPLPSARASMHDMVSWSYSPGIQNMVDAVSPTLLTGHVCRLQDDDAGAYCNANGSRFSYASAKLDQAAQYLYEQFSMLGLSVRYDPFVLYSAPITNVVAELAGVGPESDHVYIVSAHYDSTSSSPYDVAPGADDNASGTAAVLETARILSQHSFAHTVRFVLFAGEEQGLLGSAHYAREAYVRGDTIDGVINLDMIGYESSPPNDHIVELHAGTNLASIAIADAMVAHISTYGLALAPQVLTDGATTRSDHASFWSFGYPAILGIEDFQDLSPNYHRTTDTLEHLQVPLMVDYTKATVATIADLAGLTVHAMPTATPSATPTSTPTCTPSATATSEPELVEVSVTLQQGSGGYTGAEDTYLYRYIENRNYCDQRTFQVGYKQQYAGLLSFDVSSIPAADATIVHAELQVYAVGWGGSNITLGAYQVLRSTSLCQATWSRASAEQSWGLPGAGDTSSDRRASAESVITTAGIRRWYGLDLTQTVQTWVRDSRTNRGVLLLGVSGQAYAFQFASAQNTAPALRPKLVLMYRSRARPGAR